MKIHPLAKLTPLMSDEEYGVLVTDIKKNGLLYPIVIYEGSVLDGRHRMKACQALGIKPDLTKFNGDKVSAQAFVLASNVHRRHLTRDQKQRIITAELRRDPAQSDRSIAKKASVSPPTVATARKAAPPNVKTLHSDSLERTPERREATGKKARGRKPKSSSPPPPLTLASVSKPKDLEAKRIIREIEGIDPSDLSDPGSFGGNLYVQCKRFGERLKMRR
ncbi:MAG: ParB N-terminal domain-containing protein [Blastocatellia bacterium]|nr:ParB N-terminal domain-containing protein [Blastocatellia bacterium]